MRIPIHRPGIVPALLCLLSVAAAAPAWADVIYAEDGTVYIGTVVTADKNGVTLQTFGKTTVIPPGSILRTETDREKIQAVPVEVILKDGSLFRGRITDFDPDIGLLLDMEFGTLTIPLENLRTVQDPQQRSRYNGAPALAGLSAEYYFPLGGFAESFDSSFSFSLYGDLNLQVVRGLSLCLEATQLLMNYKPSTEVSYAATALTLSPTYRLLLLRSMAVPFLMDLVPWAGAGAGVTYISMQDRRAGAIVPSGGELNFTLCASAGIDWLPLDRLTVRLGGRWMGLVQTTGLLNLIAVRLGAAYNF